MMRKQVLIAYASGAGSTAEVAEAIAEVLRQGEVAVDVRAVTDVGDIASYDAVVVGSSIRMGRWLPEAAAFVENMQTALSHKPVAYFTTCLTMAKKRDDNRRIVMAYMDPVLRGAPDVNPVGLGLFAGSLAPGQALLMPGHTGPYGDFRDWDVIRDWAARIRPALLGGTGDPSRVSDLQGAVLSFTDLSGINLSEVNLKGAEVVEADLSEADLEGSQMHWTNFSESDLAGAHMADANLIGANLHAANLAEADLSDAILNGADLSEADLQGANLQGADMNWVNLSGANLRGADLSEATLLWANLSEAQLEGVVLAGAHYNEHTRWPDGFDPAAAGGTMLGHLRM